MSVVVKIHEARVDYDTADHIQEADGVLQVFEEAKVVGIHPKYEWKWAAVHKDDDIEDVIESIQSTALSIYDQVATLLREMK